MPRFDAKMMPLRFLLCSTERKLCQTGDSRRGFRTEQEKYLPSSTNTVMVHILNLRKKVEDDASSPKIIRTVWGKGYQVD